MGKTKTSARLAALGSCGAILALMVAGGTAAAAPNPMPRRVALDSRDVTRIVQQAVGEAVAIDESVTVAVVDRVGHVIAVSATLRAAGEFATIDPTRDVKSPAGLAGVEVPAGAGAIA